MTGSKPPGFSRREREIMDTLFQMGEGSVHDVAHRLDDHGAYDSLRVTLGILERKGWVRHRREGKRYIFEPTIPHEKARDSALTHVMHTFFGGSPSRTIEAMLDISSEKMSSTELQELQALVVEKAEALVK